LQHQRRLVGSLAPPKNPGEGKDGTAVETGKHYDVETDHKQAKNGVMASRDQPALSPEKVNLCQYSGLTGLRLWLRSAITTAVALIALLSPCGGLFTASAQSLPNTIPRYQAPLARTFPPADGEQTPTGTGKFVIFTREPTDKPNEWDFIAGAWECIPSRPNLPVTKRVEFCHSSWEAQPLLDCLVRDESDGLFPRFVWLKVDAGNYGCTVNLYDINYRTWDVRCIWQGDRLSAFGVIKNSAFCKDSRSWFRLDTSTGKIDTNVPFIPLDVDGAFWLVRKPDESSGTWSYDRAKEEFVGHFGDVDERETAHNGSLLSADGKNRARILVPRQNDWRRDVVGGTFLLQRNGHSEDIRVPVMMQVEPIRGTRRLMPIGTHLGFTKDGKVEFSATQRMKDQKERVWTIDIASGKTDESVRPYVEPKDDTFGLFDGVPAPDYLQPYLKNLRHFGRGGLAPAFLMHLGILKDQPEYPDCTVGVSPDGNHILYKAKKGRLADVFIYGNLRTRQTVRWASPDKIKLGDSMEFIWVETP
jgi:hypothetical protein